MVIAISSITLLSVLVIAITGYVPTVNDPEVALSIMLLCLSAVIVILPLAIVSGFANDLVANTNVKDDK